MIVHNHLYLTKLFCRWWVWVGGPILALLAEFTHEYTENTSWMIQLYRQNSGTSALYEGDSWQNIGR